MCIVYVFFCLLKLSFSFLFFLLISCFRDLHSHKLLGKNMQLNTKGESSIFELEIFQIENLESLFGDFCLSFHADLIFGRKVKSKFYSENHEFRTLK